MNDVRIFRPAYRRAAQSELVSYVSNLLSQIQSLDVFAPMAAQRNALADALEDYKSAQVAAMNRSMVETAAKNEARKRLHIQLDALADAVEQIAAGDAFLLISAGFTLSKPRRRFNTPPEAPKVLYAISTGRTGEVKIKLSDEIPRAVLTHVVEYSADQGKSWKNGVYHSRSTFMFDGLPSSLDLQLRVRSIGFRDLVSEPSEVVKLGVV